tara:strand:+ start:72 stop:821 length:750 start_codon:yes stop_codon:yes gene_type:complete
MGIKIKKIDTRNRDLERLMVGLSEMPSSPDASIGGVTPNALRYLEKDEYFIDNDFDILEKLKEAKASLTGEDAYNFDLIIFKISESINYEERLRGFIIKVYESDHFDKNNDIKNITSTYFERKKYLIDTGNKELYASKYAYELATKNFLNDYESFYKRAQYAENSPIYVAEQLSSIIKIMLQRIKPESRMKSMNSIRDKIKEFNIPEIANKKSPGGAAIGVTISLVKNILMARDQFFIDAVIKELILRL